MGAQLDPSMESILEVPLEILFRQVGGGGGGTAMSTAAAAAAAVATLGSTMECWTTRVMDACWAQAYKVMCRSKFDHVFEATDVSRRS